MFQFHTNTAEPVDLFCLTFSHWRFQRNLTVYLFINYAYIWTGIGGNLKETVLYLEYYHLNYIRTQNIKAKEVYFKEAISFLPHVTRKTKQCFCDYLRKKVTSSWTRSFAQAWRAVKNSVSKQQQDKMNTVTLKHGFNKMEPYFCWKTPSMRSYGYQPLRPKSDQHQFSPNNVPYIIKRNGYKNK